MAAPLAFLRAFAIEPGNGGMCVCQRRGWVVVSSREDMTLRVYDIAGGGAVSVVGGPGQVCGVSAVRTMGYALVIVCWCRVPSNIKRFGG